MIAIHPRALAVAVAFWIVVAVGGHAGWGLLAVAAAAAVDWSAIVLPFLPQARSADGRPR